MDGLSLIRHAQSAGLAVAVSGNKLVIRGPKRAEPVASLLIAHKPAVIAALSGDGSAAEWRTLYRDRLAYWLAPRVARHRAEGTECYTAAEAQRLAWGEIEGTWHRRHGALVHLGLCAGCLQPLDRATAFRVGGGNEVHPQDDAACLIACGARWRAAARKALLAMGLEQPPEGGSP